MSEFVRVRAENGEEVSVPAAVAEGAGLKPLSKSAYANDGSLLPTKPRVSKGAASATTTKTEADASPEPPKEG